MNDNGMRIGYLGVGLMGHGAAMNIIKKCYPLRIVARDEVSLA